MINSNETITNETTNNKLKQYIIYEIRPINKDVVYSYIGSTISYRNRKAQHKRNCINSTLKLYIFLLEKMVDGMSLK